MKTDWDKAVSVALDAAERIREDESQAVEIARELQDEELYVLLIHAARLMSMPNIAFAVMESGK